jgi:hypothetical protein
MKKSELKEMIKARVKGLMEAGKEVVITTQDGTAKTASSTEKLRAKQASDNDDVVTYQKRGATNESKEFLKMQKLAGLITEGQFQKKMEEVSSTSNSLTYKDPELEGFTWNAQPAHPEDILFDHDEEEEFSKADFWKYNDTSEQGRPTYGNIEDDGKWRFQWDAGDISGFVEGEDFTFGK